MNSLLKEIIIEKISKEGPISFHDFMEACLYYPEIGYYTSAGNKIGKQGDYYTSPCYSSLLGTMLAKQLEEIWYLLDKKAFTLVEYGAGTGMLCHDILHYLANNIELYAMLQYCIIEKSAVMREKEREILPDKVQWYNSIYDIPPFKPCCCIL